MHILQSIILGLVQGLTEFLPISSSAHLVILPKLFNWQDQGLVFDVLLHLGTLMAVLFLFRKDWINIIKGLLFWKDEKHNSERKLLSLTIIGIIPALIAGLFLGNFVENQWRSPVIISINLIFWGLILGIADLVSRRNIYNESNPKNITKKESLIVGIFQAISVIPGGSRSGLSITGGLFLGLTKKAAIRFSFLMSAPLIAAAALFEGIKIIKDPSININAMNLLVGFLAALISGFLAIKILNYIAEKWSLMPFVIYRIALGILIIIFLV
jgi:undecaprenyl-diphosphatase